MTDKSTVDWKNTAPGAGMFAMMTSRKVKKVQNKGGNNL